MENKQKCDGSLFLIFSVAVSIVTRSVVTWYHQQCWQKHNTNIFHAYAFYATMESTGHTEKCGGSQDAHNKPTLTVTEQLSASYKQWLYWGS